MGSQKFNNIHPNTTKSLFPQQHQEQTCTIPTCLKNKIKNHEKEKNFIINQHIKQM